MRGGETFFPHFTNKIIKVSSLDLELSIQLQINKKNRKMLFLPILND